MRKHRYCVSLTWTGNRGAGTVSARGYARSHRIEAAGHPPISGSSDPAFRGDPACWNPEELLLASLSACHQLWYLGLCAEAGVVVVAYRDEPEGVLVEEADGAGQFASVLLRPRVTLAPGSDRQVAEALHAEAHRCCFIARSVSFPVQHAPITEIAG